ncbi:MAG: bifunctional UDP-N-acetylglucosamine diphosphorylase/glucosamine-1-phosphate N-acetyltransferase GlmU [Clostridiales bacterium]|nr:bifunctional UDP-N-acetylglucosamine diphosphorylase/glucosamine-1-phosphate N-acetyltransferase GlmU [Clostridiales bacterium]
MESAKCVAVILAAGEGTRMKSSLPKVLHKAAGKELVRWAAEAAMEACGTAPVIVYGSGGNLVPETIGEPYAYALQDKRMGSGHAVMCAKEAILASGAEYTFVLAGDMPLVRAESIKKVIDEAKNGNYDLLMLTGMQDNPTGYGRIIRKNDMVKAIVEEKDATPEQKKICEVNLSVYCFKTSALISALEKVRPNNAAGEYYITDCLYIIGSEGGKCGAVIAEDISECTGVNDRVQLSAVSKVLRSRINEKHMRNGVTMIDPESCYIDAEVEIGRDTIIYPGVILEGKTKIGEGCELLQGSRIVDSEIGNGTTVQNSVIESAVVGENTKVGPYAYFRKGTVIGNNCRVGDFVEVKNAQIKDGAKVSHLTYVGDGEIGEETNVGCGVVFGNYDGKKKARTVVGKKAFIGCNTNLIAPVTVGDGAYIVAGSTVTEDVPADALVIARARQVVKLGRGKGRYKD